MRTFIVCTILVFCCSASAYGQKYETSFYDETPFKNQAAIPTSVLNNLKSDKDVRRCFTTVAESEFSADWFEATRVNLNNDQFPDLLVKAKKDCINWGTGTAFWFFVNKQSNYGLVLGLATFSIGIDKKLTKGYHNISTGACSAGNCHSESYSFNGKEYMVKGSKDASNK